MLRQLIVFIALVAYPATAVLAANYVNFVHTGQDFPLVSQGKASGIYVAENADEGIKLAAKNLQQDIFSVTGVKPQLTHNVSQLGRAGVIVGEIGKDTLVDQLIEHGALSLGASASRWDGFQLSHIRLDKEAKNLPKLAELEQVWVIAGNDKRGTIYGIYDLSEKIGVSPWYWWADVPIAQHEALYIKRGTQVDDAPKVKYRGIFLNDEAPALSNWTSEKFGGYNAQFYQHVFELLLRLKANFLWPAMWNNAFADDDPQNMYLANTMGIVMSTSHHEPMMRADKEWNRYGEGPWEYSTNPDKLYQFWVEGAERYKDKAGMFTLGMRGQADTPMSEGENIDLLEKIVHDQREILAKTIDKPLADIPQVWALYKEVQGFYERGMRVPDDVTLLWADDNFGNIRRLPTQSERDRKGGAGVYYHFDYVGGPRSYRWINTVPLGKVWEQMNLAWEYGADKLWITNVGDLKPMELPISFFLAQAWNPTAFDAQSPAQFTAQWVNQQFGGFYGDEIRDILNTYTLHNGKRKPAAIEPDTYSILHYHEAERVSAQLAKAASTAEKIYKALPERYQASFFELVGYPMWATQAMFELNYRQALNKRYAEQDRASTADMAEQVAYWFERDKSLSDTFHQIKDGKWNHMTSQPHIGFVHWRNPPANLPPVVHTKPLAIPEVADMGVAVEGSTHYWPANEHKDEPLTLPSFTLFGAKSRNITVYNRQAKPFEWHADVSAPWIVLSTSKGLLEQDTQIAVSIDWAQLPVGEHSGTVVIKGTGWGGAIINVSAHRPVLDQQPEQGDFVEGDGYIAIDATSGRLSQTSQSSWEKVALNGRTGQSLRAVVPPYVTVTPEEAGTVSYPVYFTSSGEFPITLQLAPSLPFDQTTGIHVAVSFDEQLLDTLALPSQKDKKAWEQGVLNNMKALSTTLNVPKPGRYMLKVHAITPGAVLQRVIIDTGALQQSYLGPVERRFKR